MTHRLSPFLRRSFLLLLLMLVGCLPAAQSEKSQHLPTLAPSPTAAINLESAQYAALMFMDAWQRQDFFEMYRLISFPSQEAVPFETFQETYEDAQNEMTFAGLTFSPRTIARQADKVVMLNYDVTFTTNLLGAFTDPNRTLTLVLDSRANDWRVAWSIADIFPEFGDGAFLQFEASIPLRANIYDRNGEVLADQNGIAVRVSVIKEKIPTDIATCVTSLADVLNRPPEVVQAVFDRSGQNWVMDVGAIEPRIYTERSTQLIRDCAATFSQMPIRQYPRGSLMPHILGNVGYPEQDEVEALIKAGFNQETIIGKSGIEKSWDEVLRGKPGGRLVLTGVNGSRLRVLAEAGSKRPESIWLTIDANLQEYVLRVLGEAYLESADGWARTSKGASAIVLNVKTGEILAMVSYPTYEGNAYNPFPAVGRDVADLIQQEVNENKRLPLLNRPVQGIYPSGSIMKAIDAVAVADTGVMSMTESYMCTGVWQESDDRRFDWLAGGHGVVNVETALMQSCNPFFYTVGFRLNNVDPYILPNYARMMGLGAPTGLLDLPEAPGTIPDPEWIRINRGIPWTFSHSVSMAIGQGEVEVTPLQMAQVYAGIANQGLQYRPQLVRETGILDQRTFVAEPEITDTWDVKPEVLEMVNRGLCKVTTEANGTASHIFRRSPLQDLGVCGKTGTAQAAGDGVPPHSWFVAYGPRPDPEILVIVMVETAGDGSAIAAPLTRRIMEYYFFGPFD
jgi:penicillin-binding protein 2